MRCSAKPLRSCAPLIRDPTDRGDPRFGAHHFVLRCTRDTLQAGGPPMRIDAYTHFFPKKFFDKMQEVAGDYKDMGKRVRSLPALFDLDHRKKMVDGFKDYQQILSYPQPPV